MAKKDYKMIIDAVTNILTENAEALHDVMVKPHNVELTTSELMDLSIAVGAYLVKETYNEDGQGEEAIYPMLELKHKLDSIIKPEIKKLGM